MQSHDMLPGAGDGPRQSRGAAGRGARGGGAAGARDRPLPAGHDARRPAVRDGAGAAAWHGHGMAWHGHGHGTGMAHRASHGMPRAPPGQWALPEGAALHNEYALGSTELAQAADPWRQRVQHGTTAWQSIRPYRGVGARVCSPRSALRLRRSPAPAASATARVAAAPSASCDADADERQRENRKRAAFTTVFWVCFGTVLAAELSRDLRFGRATVARLRSRLMYVCMYY